MTLSVGGRSAGAGGGLEDAAEFEGEGRELERFLHESGEAFASKI